MKKISEVMNEFNLSRNTVMDAIKTGKIKAVKMGKQWRIEDEEVERLKKEGMK